MNKEYVMVMVKIVLLSVIAAVILGTLYIPTQEQLEKYQYEQKKLSLKIVYPEADHFESVESGEEILYYQAFDAGNNLIGYCFFHDQPGSQGTITLAGGIDTEYTVTGVKIMGHSETPGLGAKIIEDSFTGQFPGVAEDDLMLSKDGGAIDAITGATVSSVAVIDGLHAAMDEIKANE